MSTINFAGMTGAQAFYAIDKDGGVTDSDISANMEAWAKSFTQTQVDIS